MHDLVHVSTTSTFRLRNVTFIKKKLRERKLNPNCDLSSITIPDAHQCQLLILAILKENVSSKTANDPRRGYSIPE